MTTQSPEPNPLGAFGVEGSIPQPSMEIEDVR
jgi:hypothetical protein